MKKSLLSKIALGAAVVPCALVMAACGTAQIDTKATVNKGGNYVATSATAVSEYVAQETVTTEIKSGYHFTAESEMAGAKTFMNAFILTDENGVATESAIKLEVKAEEGVIKYSVYVKDGYAYLDMQIPGTTMKYKTPLLLGQEADYFLTGDEMQDAQVSITTAATEFLEHFQGTLSMGQGSETLYEVAKDGDNAKYHAKLTKEFSAETPFGTYNYKGLEMYLIFENNAFVGGTLDASATLTSGEEVQNVSQSMVVTTFNGTIQYPDLTSYTSLEDLL